MANPGSPENMRAINAAGTQSSGPNMTRMMIAMLVLMGVSMVTIQFRMQIGAALDVVFQFVAFDGKYPVISIMLVCTIAILITTTIRSLMQDPMAQARNQQIQSEFNKEFRQARIENNLYKMKKLEAEQPRMMEASMQQSTDMMKIMPITMLIFIPIIAWAWYFLSTGTIDEPGKYFQPWNEPIVDLPWCADVNLNGVLFLSIPVWFVVYMMISMPVSQIENRLIRLYLLKKELARLDSEVKRAEIE
ncbi:MAG: DUF106 domain-containing protein [Thermoplasmata archaeon]|jgi:uncharacterized membrane protein (DUF106 family)|nr:DUF106 domain-containing protein [Thermoplasmata archaeon]MBR4686523.1 DUF106 domain-containing protein [Candidatus Methanomethylophilaceae archaeon]